MVIRRGLFGLAGLWVGAACACGPDLERIDGTLAVRVIGVPSPADTVEIQVGEGESRFVARRPIGAGALSVRAPVGTTEVVARALRGEVLIGSATALAEVASQVTRDVVLDLGAGSRGWSAPPRTARATVGPMDQVGDRFTARFVFGELTPVWAQAREALFGSPTEVTLRSATLRLVSGSPVTNELDDLWTEAVSLRIDGTLVAEVMSVDGASGAFTPRGTQPSSLLGSVQTGRFEADIAGEAGEDIPDPQLGGVVELELGLDFRRND